MKKKIISLACSLALGLGSVTTHAQSDTDWSNSNDTDWRNSNDTDWRNSNDTDWSNSNDTDWSNSNDTDWSNSNYWGLQNAIIQGANITRLPNQAYFALKNQLQHIQINDDGLPANFTQEIYGHAELKTITINTTQTHVRLHLLGSQEQINLAYDYDQYQITTQGTLLTLTDPNQNKITLNLSAHTQRALIFQDQTRDAYIDTANGAPTLVWVQRQDGEVPPQIQTQIGYFMNSATEGLEYTSCPQIQGTRECITGLTGSEGDYTYFPGDNLTLHIGKLKIVETEAKPLLTPYNSTLSKEQGERVSQILQSLDSDPDDKTKITISPQVRENARVLASSQNIGAVTSDDEMRQTLNQLAPGSNLVKREDASARTTISRRLTMMQDTDLGQWITGAKHLSPAINEEAFKRSVSDRLAYGLWQRRRSGLEIEASRYTGKVDQIELQRKINEQSINFVKSVFDLGFSAANYAPDKTSDLFILNKSEVTMNNAVISFVSEAVKGVALISDTALDTDILEPNTVFSIDLTTDLTKSVMASTIGDYSEMTKAVVKHGGKLAGDELQNELITAVTDNIASKMVGFLTEAIQGEKKFGGPTLYVDLAADIAKLSNNFYMANKLSYNTETVMTYAAAIEYLDMYYRRAGDSEKIIEELRKNSPSLHFGQLFGRADNPDAIYSVMWQRANNREVTLSGFMKDLLLVIPDRFIDQNLFKFIVTDTMAQIDQSTQFYLQRLMPATVNLVEAELQTTSVSICNGEEHDITLDLYSNSWMGRHNITNDVVFNQLDWGLSGAFWQRKDAENALTIHFTEPGPKVLSVRAYGTYNQKTAFGLGTNSILVEECLVPNDEKEQGMWVYRAELSAQNNAPTYETLRNTGYKLEGWFDAKGQLLSTEPAITITDAMALPIKPRFTEEVIIAKDQIKIHFETVDSASDITYQTDVNNFIVTSPAEFRLAFCLADYDSIFFPDYSDHKIWFRDGTGQDMGYSVTRTTYIDAEGVQTCAVVDIPQAGTYSLRTATALDPIWNGQESLGLAVGLAYYEIDYVLQEDRLQPQVTSVTPTSMTLGAQLQEFVITGQYLPQAVTGHLQGADCPSEYKQRISSTEFRLQCRHDTAETLTLEVKTQSQGELIGQGFAINVTAQPTQTTGARKLNDTGITWGGNYPSGNNSDCTGETIGQQDCSHGRDAVVGLSKTGEGHAGFDFTRLNADGSTYTGNGNYTEAPWACVKDNHTGLVWEVKTPAGSGDIHDASNRYRWGGKTALLTGEFGTRHNDWDTLVDGSNSKNLCGFNDWRVPSRDELRSIVNYGRFNPAIDQSVFPNTRSSWYWSASPYASGSNFAWGVVFNNGYDYDDYRYSGARVRLVRSGQ
ncbi:Lcl C-terminal domain-containing protein [Thiomicrospira microaerophila]|uniref:Lcl C-terminal domain-containing protein n=1 Tax=Thiomicrospira microaerophila TaxID=406020 RepID=UPI0005C92710|nr:DUF1566 domain-containing protein [Thiomicrospira microaerophila]